MGFSQALMKAWLTSSLVTSFLSKKVKSVIDPVVTGTLKLIPSKSPLSSGIVSVVAIAAPVVVGTIFCAAARARLKSLWEPSCKT